MNKEELNKLECELQERGYSKYPAPNNADYAWFKSFGQSEYSDGRSNYQIAFSIYDFSPYAYRDENLAKNPYSCTPTILLSRTIDERYDLEMGTIDYKDIDKVEKLAESFLYWAKSNIVLYD